VSRGYLAALSEAWVRYKVLSGEDKNTCIIVGWIHYGKHLTEIVGVSAYVSCGSD